jgi:hypothetical protein
MVVGLLLLLCGVFYGTVLCAKIKQDPKKCLVGQEHFRAQYVVFPSTPLPGYFIEGKLNGPWL